MPNAPTHDAIALITSFAILPGSYALLLQSGETPTQASVGAAIVVVAHLVGSFWLSPDLDLDGAIDNRWGPLFWIWRPYMWAVPHRHRILSHSGFSALLRLGYLYLVISLLLFGVGVVANAVSGVAEASYYDIFRELVIGTITEHPREARLIAVGVVLSDLIHTITDHLVTNGKGLLRFFGIRITRDYRNHDRWRRSRR
ncbi:MAG: metal-binding protein [Chloroflexaceae bacterium]|jgi:uncharacterized metal-binding protein|nr:metal-binding protein [Chloroflexaceae bacterium]